MTVNIQSLGHYEGEIQKRFADNHCGLNLESIGMKRIERFYPVDNDSVDLVQDKAGLRAELTDIIDFVNRMYKSSHIRPIWHKTNVIDQAINEYVGIGFLNIEDDWIAFILNYMSFDKAEQSGDTLITLFDIQFNWAVNFELSQDDNRLVVQLFKD